jgi:hypothetical protein
MTVVVKIAECPDHGLHGERERCFICSAPCRQVEMIPTDVVPKLTALVSGAQEFLEATAASHYLMTSGQKEALDKLRAAVDAL